GFYPAERIGGKLAVWGRSPDGPPSKEDCLSEEIQGKTGAGNARTGHSGRGSMAGPATADRPGAEPAAWQIPRRHRAVRPRGQASQGNGSPTRLSRRHRCRPAGASADNAGETPGPSRSHDDGHSSGRTAGAQGGVSGNG